MDRRGRGPAQRHHAIIDAECCCDGENGIANFERLQARVYDGIAYAYAFDLLAVDGIDTRSLPLSERKAALAHLLRKAKPGHPLQRTPRGRWRKDIRAGLPDGPGGHRVEAARLAVPKRQGKILAQDEEPEVSGSHADRTDEGSTNCD